MGLGKIERKQRVDSVRVTDTELVTLTTEGVEVQVGDNAPWVISHRTLIDLANKELMEELQGRPQDRGVASLTPKATKPPKAKPLDAKQIGKLVGPLVGKKKLTPQTVNKYLKAIRLLPVGKLGKKTIYGEAAIQKVAERYRQTQAEVSKKAAARYDPTTRRLGHKRQPA